MEQNPSIKLGFSSMIIIFLLTINYIGQLFKHYYYYIFSNIPLFTVLQLEIWRIVTGFFTSSSLYEYIFNSFITVTIFNYWENKEGTSKHSIILFSNLIIFQVSILMLYLILVWFFPVILSFSIKSLPGLGIAFLVRHLLLTSTKAVIIYPGIQINDRLLIVLFLVGFIFLCGFELRIEMVMSFYYGFLMCKYSKFYEVEMITEDIITSFEASEKYKGLFNLDNWILLDEKYINSQRERSNSIGKSIDNNPSEEIQQDNKIEIIEDKQEGDIKKTENNPEEPKAEEIGHDFVDLSLDDNNI